MTQAVEFSDNGSGYCILFFEQDQPVALDIHNQLTVMTSQFNS